MSSVGSYLRELRERRGVSLEEISRTTRVGRSYLEALEAGEFGKLPAPVFTRGFVVAYCQALGVSSDEALTRFVGHTASVPDAKVEPTPLRERTPARGRGPVLVSFVLLIVLGLALFAVALVLQSGREVDDRRADTTPGVKREEPAPPVTREPVASEAATPAAATTQNVAPPAGEAPASSAGTPGPSAPVAPAGSSVPQVSAGSPPPITPPATALATKEAPPSRPATAVAAPAAVPPAIPPAAVTATLSQRDATAALASVTSPPYRLIARTSASTWIRVRTDDGRVSDETVPAGQVREWVSNRPFTISVGNAGGVRLELNGRALPALGPAGVVIGRLVLPAEIP